MSKLAKATEIVKAAANKQQALDQIVSQLGVTRANAFVYFTKASKAIGGVKLEKGEKPVAQKANPVTGTTPTQRKEKVEQINRVIKDMKQKFDKQTAEQRATGFWQQMAGQK